VPPPPPAAAGAIDKARQAIAILTPEKLAASGEHLRQANILGDTEKVLAAANSMSSTAIGGASGNVVKQLRRGGAGVKAAAGLNTLPPAELAAGKGSKRKQAALLDVGGLLPHYQSKKLPELSAMGGDDWAAAHRCGAGHLLYQAGMQASDIELTDYGTSKVELFLRNDPGKKKNVLRYLDALATRYNNNMEDVRVKLMNQRTSVLQAFVTSPSICVGPISTWGKGIGKPTHAQTNEWKPVLARFLAAIATASSTSDAPTRASIAAEVEDEALLRVNRSGKSVQATDEELAVLRSALRLKGCVRTDVDWEEVGVALAVVSGYERSWNHTTSVVKTMANKMCKEATKETKQGGKQGGKTTGKKGAGKKELKKVVEKRAGKKGGKAKTKAKGRRK
jgi:hypothetical protein